MRITGLALTVSGSWFLAVACFATSEGVLSLHRDSMDAGAAPILRIDGGAGSKEDASLPNLPPHSVVSVDPAHGPFPGGSRVLIRGTGFSSAVRVWFGDVPVPIADVVPVDPSRIQVTVPAGHAGTVDVVTQNGDDTSTLASLRDGYFYDSFYVDPSSGPVSGGTLITLHGDGTTWDEGTKVFVDTTECEVVAIRRPDHGPEELDCKTPPGTPGAKRVRVESDGGSADVLDAFTYGDTNNGFSGGLSGNPLAGKLRVITLNGATTRAMSATVILGTEVTEQSVLHTDQTGVLDVTDQNLGGKVTVTVAAPCFMPTTFVDVPVDTVTAFLDPVLSPDCIPKNGGGTGVGTGGGSTSVGATLKGELVFPSTIEFRRGPWTVPIPSVPDGDTNVRRVAYLFPLAANTTQALRLPPKGDGVTPDDTGRIGYTFASSVLPGNVMLYALAGVEDRGQTPPVFTAYTLGISPNTGVSPGATVEDVFIKMDIPLDHALSLTVNGPQPTSRGPDRVEARIGIRVGTFGYVVLPIGVQTSLLPATSPLSFVGLPPLVNGLAGAEYLTTTMAFTGESHSPPRSALAAVSTTTPGTSQSLSGFMEVPVLSVPASGTAWNGQDFTVNAAPGGPDADLLTLELQSGGGLSTWLVVAPGSASSVRVPDLAQVPGAFGPSGALSLTVTRGKLDTFSYGSLRYGQLAPRAFTTYAQDVFQTHR